MLDMILDALQELFNPQPREQRNTAGQNRPRPRKQVVDTFGGQTVRADPDDPAYPSQSSREPAPPVRRTLTLEDIVRKLAGVDDWDDTANQGPARPAEQRPPREEAPPPRRRPQTPAKAKTRAAPAVRPARHEETPAQEELDKFRNEQNLGSLAPLDASGNANADHSLDFVAHLRENPQAARDAFVYSVVFGRPIGEQPLEEK